MAKNPKIEFFKIDLQPINNPDLAFRDLFRKNYELHQDRNSENVDDNALMIDFLRHFFSRIDTGVVLNRSKRKAFKARYFGEDAENNNVHLMSQNNIIYGIIKGGEYDTGKYLGQIDDPDSEEERLEANKLITDDFYFLLYTPLDKSIGVLILQTYTRDNINDIFKPFIEKLFKVNGITNKATSSVFMPKALQNRFRNNSVVKTFVYSNRFIVNAMDQQTIQTGDFTVKVEITSHGDQVNLNNLPWWKRVLGRTNINIAQDVDRQLATFMNQNGYLQSQVAESTPTKFQLDDNDFEIKPTIFLRNNINLEENGIPLFDELHQFALQTLNESVIPDIYPEDDLL